MIHRAATTCLMACLLTLNTQSSSHGQDKDKVYPIKGAPATGKISEITPDQITIEVKNKNQVYKTNDILKVTFDGEPVNVDRAREFIASRQFTNAESELQKIDPAKINDPRILQDVQFYKGYVAAKLSLSGMGNPRDAARILNMAAKADPKSHHAYKSHELLGELAMALGLQDAANGYFVELGKAPFPELQALSAYKQAEVALNSGKTEIAQKLFQQLSSSVATDAETIRLKNLAEVGLAVCDAKAGKSKEALEKLQGLVAKHDSSDQVLFARIFNAQGMCYQALKQPREAALAYLKTDLLFSSAPDLHAEALYQLTKLFPEIGIPQRAIEARQQLTAKYPNSPWSNKQ